MCQGLRFDNKSKLSVFRKTQNNRRPEKLSHVHQVTQLHTAQSSLTCSHVQQGLRVLSVQLVHATNDFYLVPRPASQSAPVIKRQTSSGQRLATGRPSLRGHLS